MFFMFIIAPQVTYPLAPSRPVRRNTVGIFVYNMASSTVMIDVVLSPWVCDLGRV